jgi:transmembrane sensor
MAADSRDSKVNPAPDDPLSALERAAANWLVACDHGLSPAKRAEFEAWLAASPKHAEMFAEMDAAWRQLGGLRDAPAIVEELSATHPPAARRSAWPWLASLGFAAAAVIGFFLAPRAHRSVSVASSPYAISAATELGATRTLALPDGSTVQLNTDTAVAVRFTRDERRIELTRGEAYFHVAKDAQRPFLVTASRVVVRAVGTQFDVHVKPTEVVVLVTEGKVRLSDATHGGPVLPGNGAEPPILAAGERVVVPTQAAQVAGFPSKFAPDEEAQALAWKSGRLDFVNAPLETIVEEFNRYNRHKLTLGDAALATRRFGGTFSTNDYDAFVRVLENEFGIVAERREGETVLRERR